MIISTQNSCWIRKCPCDIWKYRIVGRLVLCICHSFYPPISWSFPLPLVLCEQRKSWKARKTAVHKTWSLWHPNLCLTALNIVKIIYLFKLLYLWYLPKKYEICQSHSLFMYLIYVFDKAHTHTLGTNKPGDAHNINRLIYLFVLVSFYQDNAV